VGKRGPKPRKKSERSHVFSTRLKPELWEALKAAARARGRPISEEVHGRLSRTFREDERVTERFGGRRNFALIRIMTGIMQLLGASEDGQDWMDDPKLFAQMRDALLSVLETLEPSGVESVHNTFEARNRGKFAAFNTMGAIAMADENPSLKASNEEWTKGMLRRDLGDAVLRHFHTDPPASKKPKGKAGER
jgi:hypothetical protein